MARIKMLQPAVPRSDGRTIRPEPKRVDPFYMTPEHKLFREAVLANAGNRCEWIENGQRCMRTGAQHRLFADHIRERSDGGNPFDPANGQCLCGSHHTLKTARARSARATGRSMDG